MCASHLLRIVDNRAAKRNNNPRSNYLARYGGMDHSVAGEPTEPTTKLFPEWKKPARSVFLDNASSSSNSS